jgi:hypothetical protein
MKLAVFTLVLASCGEPEETVELVPLQEVTASVVDYLNTGFARDAVSLEYGGYPVAIGYGDLSRENAAGLTRTEGFFTKITIDPVIAKREMPQIVMHEFGHAFGLSHSTDEGNIMYPKVPKIPLVDAAKHIVAACTVYHCKERLRLSYE